MAVQIRKAERKQAKLRLGLVAPSGAGKTFSALQLGFGLGGKVGLIDTEHGSGDLYSHLGDYDVIELAAPFTVAKYLEAIQAFEQAGYSTIIVDSLTHAWSGEGGLLDVQGKLADRGTNSFAAWRTVTPQHNQLVEAILQSRCHVICTMRAKQEYVLEANERGKQTPKKVGLAPVQRDGMEYEFTVVLDVDMQHVAAASKDRTGLFDGQLFKITQQTGQKLKAWLETGAEPAAAPLAAAATTQSDALQAALLSISKADTMESLKGLFLQAKRDHGTDPVSDAQVEAAKNKRKAELTPAPAPVAVPA